LLCCWREDAASYAGNVITRQTCSVVIFALLGHCLRHYYAADAAPLKVVRDG